jgi:hypothetical protein
MKSTPAEMDEMHALYLEGGRKRHMAPHVIYVEATCPHSGCGQHMQGIDFQLEAYGPTIHDPLIRAWWNDTGFAGRCPHCRGWIHFTVRAKRAITDEEAADLPQLPDDWFTKAVII